MSWIRRLSLSLAACLAVVLLVPSEAAAQRGRGHVRIVRPAIVVGGWYSPFYDPFWDYGWWGPWRWPHAYYGYYGPGYGYAGGSSARVQVTPRNTEVYVDGYLAGTVDDFDGFAQRLRVEPGEHVIQLYLEGHRTITQSIYFQPGETYRLRHVMEPLASGEAAPRRPTPSAAGAPAGSPEPPRDRPMGPRPPRSPGGRDPEIRGEGAGTLVIRVQPGDAVVLIDGEKWESSGQQRLDVQVAVGTHRVEVQKDGYQSFTTTVHVRAGESTPLNVSLSPRQ